MGGHESEKMIHRADRSRSSASRQRRHHQRLVNGRCVVAVEIDDVAVPQVLKKYKYLGAGDLDNRGDIGRAITRLLEDLVLNDASAPDL